MFGLRLCWPQIERPVQTLKQQSLITWGQQNGWNNKGKICLLSNAANAKYCANNV